MKKTKKILLILTILIFGTVFLSSLPLSFKKKVSAQGWLSGFNYRVKIPVNPLGGGETDYQMRVHIYKGIGTNTTEDDGKTLVIYLNNHAENWPFDIRFTTDDGTTTIPFWRERYDADDGIWWVKIPTIHNNLTVDYYLYYGSNSASDESNGENTFVYFNDFSSDPSLHETVYYKSGGTDTCACGACNVYYDSQNERINFDLWRHSRCDRGDYITWFSLPYSITINNIALRYKRNVTSHTKSDFGINGWIGLFSSNYTYSSPKNFGPGIDSQADVAENATNTQAQTWVTASDGTNKVSSTRTLTTVGDSYIIEAQITSNIMKILVNDVEKYSATPPSGIYTISADRFGFMVREYNDWRNLARDIGWIDDLVIRKYHSPEPTWATPGSEETQALGCQDHNVQGWAWSERTGWISFSCENCDADFDGNWDGGNCGAGSSIDYGVDIDDGQGDPECNGVAGEMCGYAWSERAGWISFNSSDLIGCPSGTCEAKVNMTTGEVSGWAKAINADGWDGWIHLRDTNYGVYIDSTTSPAEFKNWAWSDEVIGWISFNCENCENNPDCDKQAACNGTHPDYKVTTDLTFVSPPTVSNPRETFYYCSDSLHPILEWDYSDGTSDGYKVEVYSGSNLIYQYEASGISSTSHSANYDAGICHIGGNGFQNDPVCDFEYNTTYSWRVKAKNQDGVWSEWSDWDNFTTPLHSFPQPEFTWSPSSPRINEETQFTDQTVFGTGASPSWSWTIPDAVYTGGTSSSSQNPVVIFQSSGEKEVILQATDTTLTQNGTCGAGCCDISHQVNVRYSIPEWEEVHPGE